MLAGFLHEQLKRNGIAPARVVEPFAGGASISISFLQNTQAEVVLSDADPMLAAFWRMVFSREAPFLAEWIAETIPTRELWAEWNGYRGDHPLELAFKCLFLSRTNYNGILRKGSRPRAKVSGITCRFNGPRIARRILELWAYRDRVRVLGALEWQEVIARLDAGLRGTLWFLDPPYFRKAERLYRRWFAEADHRALKESLPLLQEHFCLTYDDVPEALALYDTFEHLHFRASTKFSTQATTRRPRQRELIVSSFAICEKSQQPRQGEFAWQ